MTDSLDVLTRDPSGMRPLIIKTIERIENAA